MQRLTNCIRFRSTSALRHLSTVIFAMTCVVVISQPACGRRNLFMDPGFEKYRLDPRGFYKPAPDASWQEITLGKGSVQVDMNDWQASAEMLSERPLGFTPGTIGYEGAGAEQNTGRIILQQDITLSDISSVGDNFYEAWIWLGGAGRDDDNNADRKDEAGGWELFFYANDDTSTWTENNRLERHHMSKDFWGEPGTFVQVAGYGRIPPGAKGVRMRVWAATWGQASTPSERISFNTEVAIDNAHFAVIESANMLINGDFEMDDRVAEFKGWQRPSPWPFPRNGLKPLDINDVFDGYFDHGKYRPFFGARHAYGYATYLSGWRKDAFTFGQYADYNCPDGTPLVLMFNWIQGVAHGGETQLRLIGTRVEIVAEYVGVDGRIGVQSFWLDWPTPAGPAAVGRYDQNSGRAFCPRLLLNPPAGTKRVGIHVNFMVHTPYKDGFKLINAAIDDFFLVPAQ